MFLDLYQSCNVYTINVLLIWFHTNLTATPTAAAVTAITQMRCVQKHKREKDRWCVYIFFPDVDVGIAAWNVCYGRPDSFTFIFVSFVHLKRKQCTVHTNTIAQIVIAIHNREHIQYALLRQQTTRLMVGNVRDKTVLYNNNMYYIIYYTQKHIHTLCSANCTYTHSYNSITYRTLWCDVLCRTSIAANVCLYVFVEAVVCVCVCVPFDVSKPITYLIPNQQRWRVNISHIHTLMPIHVYYTHMCGFYCTYIWYIVLHCCCCSFFFVLLVVHTFLHVSLHCLFLDRWYVWLKKMHRVYDLYFFLSFIFYFLFFLFYFFVNSCRLLKCDVYYVDWLFIYSTIR